MKLSEREKRMMAVLLIVAVAVAFYVLFMKKQMNEISQNRQKSYELSKQLDDITNMVNSFNAAKDKEDAVMNDYYSVSGKLPPNQDEKFSIIDSYNISKVLDTKLGDITISKKEPAVFQINDTKIDKAYTYTLKANWTLTYDNIKKLLNYSKEYPVIYSVNNITSAPDKEGKVNLSMNLKFYGFDDKSAPTRIWSDIPVDAGKENIFSEIGKGAAAVKNQEDSIDNLKKNKDFMIALSTTNDPSGSVVLEKSGKGTDIYGSNKSIEDVNINITGNKDKYSYSMSTGADSYPKNGGSEEFKPLTDRIIILISSQTRKYADDKNRVVINIHNTTDKKVYVYITGDDSKLPRATIVKDGQDIYVYNK